MAYYPAEKRNTGRGRKREYGEKIKLRELFEELSSMQTAPSPIYGESGGKLRYLSVDLIWRSAGKMVRFVAVRHPTRGKYILMSTDLTLPPLEIIRLYGLRFKIEVSFKQAVKTLGTYVSLF